MEEFLEFAEDMKEDVVRLLRNQPNKSPLWKWQYADNPNRTGQPCGIVLRVDGRIAGFNGIMPVRIGVDGAGCEAAWSVDAYVSAELRGRGLGKRLYSLVEGIAPIMLAYGMSDASAALFTQRGWTFSTEVEEYYYQNRPTDLRGLAKVLIRLATVYARRPVVWEGELVDLAAAQLPKECDELWRECRSGYQRTVVRDYTYLKWKYGDHPSQRYRLLAAWAHGRLRGVLIYRCDRQLGRLVDYLGGAEDVQLKAFLVEAFMSACRASQKVHAVTTDRDFKAILRRLGFRRYSPKPRFAVRSSVPLSRPAADWFLMTGDSDGDLVDAMN